MDATASAFPAENLLGRETSPYLLQHRDNPVHWRPWGEAAFAEARARDVPVLLSVGYAACHWCHVMAHESFEDEATAALMNRLFVNVKVDREERPDVDAIYMNALHMMGEQGGWPLTMFLTPAAEPFWGGTYFPPTARWGRPGFPDLLRGIAAAWRDKQHEVRKNVDALVGALRRRADGAGGRVDPALADRLAGRLVEAVDTVHGGLQGSPKFPQSPIFALMWRSHLRTGDAAAREAVVLTLDRMCQGGIYDHLGGGFARYSVDERWLVPHFEKMLYDNAELVELMTQVWQETRSPLYAQRIAETVAWLEREMIADGGAFASALDADSEGEEGKFYVWSRAEIDAALGPEAAAFAEAYDVSAAGNWEGHNILNRSKRMLLGAPEREAKLAAARQVLFDLRARRVPPGRDDKVLADWNGLMIAALARAGFAFGRPEWIALAKRAFAGVVGLMERPGGRLGHAYRQGRLQFPGMLDDHAMMAKAALALYEADGDGAYLARAEAWAAAAERWYWDGEAGGYCFTASDAETLIARTRNAHDQATPSGNGVMAEVLARLWVFTGQGAYRDRAEATIAAFAGELQRNAVGMATLLGAAALLDRPLAVAIAGERASADTQALLRAVAGASRPELCLSVVAPGADLPDGHPARGKGMVAGRAAAYVCEGPVCSAPVTDAAALEAALRRR